MNKAFEKILERLEEMIHPKGLYFCKYAQGGCRHLYNDEKDCMECVVELSEKIVQEVAEEYNNGWIPCSERLPEEELEKAMRERGENAVFPVLATINKVHLISGEKYKIVSRAFYGQYNDKNFYNSCCDRLDVIAWQPLPEPYQPEGE